MKLVFLCLISTLSLTITGCGLDSEDNGSTLSSNSGHSCPTGFGLTEGTGVVVDPNAKPSPDAIVPHPQWPAGQHLDGSPVRAPETAIHDVPKDYPYSTFQGEQGNCVPRAFESQSGIYDPRLENGMFPDQKIDLGGKSYIRRDSSTGGPVKGDQVWYDYDTQVAGRQGHAGICYGYTADGRCIIATGHEARPFDVRPVDQLDTIWTETK